MKINFRTHTGYLLGQATLLQLFTSIVAFLAILTFVFNDGQNLRLWFDNLINLLQLTPDPRIASSNNPIRVFDNFLLSKWLPVVKVVVSALSLWMAASRLFRGAQIYFGESMSRHFFQLTILITRKIREEILTFPNDDQDHYEQERIESLQDVKVLEDAKNNNIINVTNIRQIKWIAKSVQDRISFTHLEDSESRKHVNSLVERFIELAQKNRSAKVKIFISPVQAGILYVTQKTLRKYRLERHIDLWKSSKTGPQTIYYASLDKHSSPEKHDSVIRLFVAPLSAYVMYDEKNPETVDGGATPDQFKAAAVLMKEPQDILVVDDGNRVPLRKGRTLYYNNSTAEECWAKSKNSIRDIFYKSSVDKYDDYLSYLRGRAPQNESPLSPGDAIITWPPLTQYYAGRAIGDSHLNNKNCFKESTTSLSRIMLFIEDFSRSKTPEVSELACLFMEILMCELRSEKTTYQKMSAYTSNFFMHWRFIRKYRSVFVSLVGAQI